MIRENPANRGTEASAEVRRSARADAVRVGEQLASGQLGDLGVVEDHLDVHVVQRAFALSFGESHVAPRIAVDLGLCPGLAVVCGVYAWLAADPHRVAVVAELLELLRCFRDLGHARRWQKRTWPRTLEDRCRLVLQAWCYSYVSQVGRISLLQALGAEEQLLGDRASALRFAGRGAGDHGCRW